MTNLLILFISLTAVLLIFNFVLYGACLKYKELALKSKYIANSATKLVYKYELRLREMHDENIKRYPNG